MQKTVETQPRQTLMMARMETPETEWDELLQDAIKDWVNHSSKTCTVGTQFQRTSRAIIIDQRRRERTIQIYQER